MDLYFRDPIIAGIIASIICYWLIQFVIFLISHFKNLNLKGEYEVYRKFRSEQNGEKTTHFDREETKVIITKVFGSLLYVLYQSKNSSAAKGIIKMSRTTPNYGEGSYSHIWVENGWGIWNVQRSYNNEELLVDTRYVQSDGKALFYAYRWKKIK